MSATLRFPSAKTTHFSAMSSIGNSAVDEFVRTVVRTFGVTGSRESTAEVKRVVNRAEIVGGITEILPMSNTVTSILDKGEAECRF